MYLEGHVNKYRARESKYPELEEALFLWFCDKRALGLPISDQMLLNKANDFGVLLDIKDFKYSIGWLNNFKSRHNISSKVLCGEAGSTDSNIVDSGRESLKQITSQYNLDDIYNLDETALFFKLQPNKTLSNCKEPGKKVNKDRITVAICCNASGSDRPLPIVIGKYVRPHCFKNNKPSDILPYYSNRNAWMTSLIFDDILKKFNERIKQSDPKRKVLLLVDNASSHNIQQEYSNIKVKFLPPNCTSVLQPCDAGIIHSFKSHYRKLLVEFFLNSIEMVNKIELPNLKDALYMVRNAWKKVDHSTISNCWVKCDILRHEQTLPSSTSASSVTLSLEELLSRLRNGYYSYVCSAQEYIEIEANEPTGELLTDADIVELVKKPDESENDHEDIQEIQLVKNKKITFAEAAEGFKIFCEFVEQAKACLDEDIDKISYFKSRLTHLRESSLTQSNLNSFFRKE